MTVRCSLALAGAALLVAGGAVLSDAVAADGATLEVDRQDSQADTPVSPYADSDLHVAFEGGTQTQHSYVHLSFASLTQGTTIDSVTLTLTQSASTDGNVESQNAAIEACPLTTELPAKYDPSKPPQWDCSKVSAPGEADGNGNWRIDMQPLVDAWDHSGNTGAAILALPSPLAVGSAAGPPANNWALAFDPTRTTARASVTPPGSSADSLASVPLTVSPEPPAPAPSVALAPLPAAATGPTTIPAAPPAAGTTAPQATSPAADRALQGGTTWPPRRKPSI